MANLTPTVHHVRNCEKTGLTKIYLCSTALTRLRGIFFRPSFRASHAVLLKRCNAVHGIGLRKPLDIVFLDKHWKICAIKTLHPFCVCYHKIAEDVIELEAGRASALNLQIGSVLDIQCLQQNRSTRSAITAIAKPGVSRLIQSQRGASMTEFLITAPLLLFLGMGIVQMGFVYHARNVLEYATFEAARMGAVTNADVDAIRTELSQRLAPVFNGDGTNASVLASMGKSAVAVADPLRTQIRILNPTSAAFDDFGVSDPSSGRRILPNSHLQYRSTEVGANSGVSIQDANLLKIEVTHGFELRLPWLDIRLPGVKTVLRELMVKADPKNSAFYLRGQLPLRSVATVRMQSDAWSSHILGNLNANQLASNEPSAPGTAPGADDQLSAEDGQEIDHCNGPHGLPVGLPIESIVSVNNDNQCAVETAGDNNNVAQSTPLGTNDSSATGECTS